jgi:rhodanese-related sulfurtransferase
LTNPIFELGDAKSIGHAGQAFLKTPSRPGMSNHYRSVEASVPRAKAFIKRMRYFLLGGGPIYLSNSGMDHSPGFLQVVNEAKSRVQEVTIEQARERLKQNPNAMLIDVREDSEWAGGHAAEAVHLGKGILERDIEKAIPDKNRELIMYCGGGFRSALTADVAQKMGYKNVFSLIGGYKGLVAANWPMKKS